MAEFPSEESLNFKSERYSKKLTHRVIGWVANGSYMIGVVKRCSFIGSSIHGFHHNSDKLTVRQCLLWESKCEDRHLVDVFRFQQECLGSSLSDVGVLTSRVENSSDIQADGRLVRVVYSGQCCLEEHSFVGCYIKRCGVLRGKGRRIYIQPGSTRRSLLTLTNWTGHAQPSLAELHPLTLALRPSCPRAHTRNSGLIFKKICFLALARVTTFQSLDKCACCQ